MTRLKTKTYVISNKEKFKADVPPLTKASFKAAVIPHLESASRNSYINGTWRHKGRNDGSTAPLEHIAYQLMILKYIMRPTRNVVNYHIGQIDM